MTQRETCVMFSRASPHYLCSRSLPEGDSRPMIRWTLPPSTRGDLSGGRFRYDGQAFQRREKTKDRPDAPHRAVHNYDAALVPGCQE